MKGYATWSGGARMIMTLTKVVRMRDEGKSYSL